MGRVPLSPVFCTISQNWGKCHSPPSHPTGGGGRGMRPVASGEDVCSMTHWWHIWASEIGRGWLWGLPHRSSEMRTISCHTYNEQWGQKVTLLTAVPLSKKINSLLELHRHQRRNGMALKWRQKTFTFVIYDYRCSLVSLLLLWRNFSGSVRLSLAGPYSSSSSFEPLAPCLLTVHCQAAGSISVHRRRLYILHIVHVQMKPTYETPVYNTL